MFYYVLLMLTISIHTVQCLAMLFSSAIQLCYSVEGRVMRKQIK